jgi:hypothetical protein
MTKNIFLEIDKIMSKDGNANITPKVANKNHSFIKELKKDNPTKTKKSLSRIKSSKLIPKKEQKSISKNYVKIKTNFLSPINYNIQKLSQTPSLPAIKKFKIEDSLNKCNIKIKTKNKSFKNLKKELTPIKVVKNKKINLISPEYKNKNKNNNNNNISKNRENTPFKEKLDKKNISLFSCFKYKEENKKDLLYIPHIVMSPLDLFIQRINVVIDVTSDEIDNICNSFSVIDINKEKQLYQIYENYIKHLNELYKKKEQKFKDIYNKYNRSLLVLKKMEGNKSNLNINEIINEKQKEIEEFKKEFNLEKNILKNDLEKNINIIKNKEKLKLDDLLDCKLTDKIKKKLYEIIDSN